MYTVLVIGAAQFSAAAPGSKADGAQLSPRRCRALAQAAEVRNQAAPGDTGPPGLRHTLSLNANCLGWGGVRRAEQGGRLLLYCVEVGSASASIVSTGNVGKVGGYGPVTPGQMDGLGISGIVPREYTLNAVDLACPPIFS